MARLVVFTALILAALAAAAPARAEATVPAMLMAPGSGTVRALVIGIDHYRAVTNLRGATADARDIEASLRRMGAGDVVSLIDASATRADVLRELDGLAARSAKGDLVFITLAGHGAKERERVKGSSPDGSDEVFLLVGFDPKALPAAAEKILNHEFKHYIKLIEAKGAQVVFVADTCYGGGMAREVPVGAPALSYRQLNYRLGPGADALKPVSVPAEAFLTELDFDRTAFLAAVDSNTQAPEVMIGASYRGALSYAVARAIEGAADRKQDGRITLHEFFDYAHSVVYQLSNERQSIVTQQSPALDVDRDLVMEVGARSLGGAALPSPPAPTVAATIPAQKERLPLRVASMTGRRAALAGLRPALTPFEIVDEDDAPDLTWDPVGRDAYSAGDKVAVDVAAEDLPGVVDRTAAVRDLKDLVVKAPLDMSLLPDASLHRQGSRVEVAVRNVAGSNLVLVDITGVGEVQLLSPAAGRAIGPLPQADHREPFRVRDPYGADEILAIASKDSLRPLAEAIGKLDRRRSAGSLADTIGRFAPSDARLGLVGLYTVP